MQEQGCSASQHEEPRSSAAPHSSAGEAPAAAAGPALEHSGLFPGSQGAPTPPAVLCCFHRLHKASSDASSDVSAAALGAETSLAAERREEAPERWRDSHSTQNDFIKQMLHSTSIRGQLALDCLGESDLPWEEDEDVADPSSTAAASTPAGDADPLQDILRLCKPLQPGMEPSVPSVYSDAVGDTDRSLTSAAAGESPPPAAAATTSAATAGTTSPASSGSAVTQALFSAAASACMQLLAASPAVATAATAVPASAATATSSSTAAARGAPPPSARKGVGSGGAKDAPAGVAEVRSTRFIPAEGTPLEVSRVLGRGAGTSPIAPAAAAAAARLVRSIAASSAPLLQQSDEAVDQFVVSLAEAALQGVFAPRCRYTTRLQQLQHQQQQHQQQQQQQHQKQQQQKGDGAGHTSSTSSGSSVLQAMPSTVNLPLFSIPGERSRALTKRALSGLPAEPAAATTTVATPAAKPAITAAARRSVLGCAEESAAVRTSASGESRLITGDTGVAGVFVASHAFELGGVSGAVGCLQVHPTEATVAVAGTTSGETFLLDLEGLRIRSALPHCSRSSRGNPGNNRRACSSVAWVEAQGLIAVGSCEGRIALLDPRVGKEVSSWHAQKGPIDSFRAVGPYGRLPGIAAAALFPPPIQFPCGAYPCIVSAAAACVSASSKEAFLNFWDIRVPPQDPLQPFSSCDSQDWWCGGGMGARRGVLSCMRFEDGISDVAVSPEESCFAVATLGGDVTLMSLPLSPHPWLLSFPVCELWDLHDTSYRAQMSVWGSSWDHLRPYPLPPRKQTQPRVVDFKPSPLLISPDCLFPQLLAVQSTSIKCSSKAGSSSSNSSSSRPFHVFLNNAFLDDTGGQDAAQEGKAEATATVTAAYPKKSPDEGESFAEGSTERASAAAAAGAAVDDNEETLLEWARNEASKFEGPLGGDMRTPARAFCCSLWRDKVLGVGGPAHLGGALHLWDASSGFLCSSSVSPQSQQQIRCIAPHPRGAPLALTGGISSSRGGVVVLWGYLSVGQMEDADLVAL
ncbi:uncharacterized protein LOC34618291 [Cyclospora cayetanensis]|uniref:Uncharacterized protein LOC34618291 n=1 Tax=Cyclospora cayetanensis TaxID=88456 RepID=A0A6P6RRI9_9EIME|nr:uncharacterized protein LOC34618291 [Cyclospora cayetanensis]